jgi:hypothetical protein
MTIDDLYKRDFYVWTQEQAAALRAAAKAGGRSNAVECELLAEEVEDLGNSQHFAVRSLVRQIIAHLFKLAWSTPPDPRAGWRAEITTFGADALDRMTASIRAKVEADLERQHLDALKAARASFAAHEPDAPRDEALRWTLPQILGEAGDPLEG